MENIFNVLFYVGASVWPRAPRRPAAAGQPLLGSLPSASYSTPPFSQALTRGCPDFYLEDEETEAQRLLIAVKGTGQGAKGAALTCLYLTTERPTLLSSRGRGRLRGLLELRRPWGQGKSPVPP